jgi:hydrogenase maturation protease
MAEAVELVRVLDQLPRRLLVYGIEGEIFTAGIGWATEIAQAVAIVA